MRHWCGNRVKTKDDTRNGKPGVRARADFDYFVDAGHTHFLGIDPCRVGANGHPQTGIQIRALSAKKKTTAGAIETRSFGRRRWFMASLPWIGPRTLRDEATLRPSPNTLHFEARQISAPRSIHPIMGQNARRRTAGQKQKRRRTSTPPTLLPAGRPAARVIAIQRLPYALHLDWALLGCKPSDLTHAVLFVSDPLEPNLLRTHTGPTRRRMGQQPTDRPTAESFLGGQAWPQLACSGRAGGRASYWPGAWPG